MQLNTPIRTDAIDAIKTSARAQLASAPNAQDPESDAALALLALWIVAEDPIHFGELIETAMTLTESDHEEVLLLALKSEFHAAARWLVNR